MSDPHNRERNVQKLAADLRAAAASIFEAEVFSLLIADEAFLGKCKKAAGTWLERCPTEGAAVVQNPNSIYRQLCLPINSGVFDEVASGICAALAGTRHGVVRFADDPQNRAWWQRCMSDKHMPAGGREFAVKFLLRHTTMQSRLREDGCMGQIVAEYRWHDVQSASETLCFRAHAGMGAALQAGAEDQAHDRLDALVDAARRPMT